MYRLDALPLCVDVDTGKDQVALGVSRQITPAKVEFLSFSNNIFMANVMDASYFHKGLMWRGVKVEISRKNSSGYDKSIFSKVL